LYNAHPKLFLTGNLWHISYLSDASCIAKLTALNR